MQSEKILIFHTNSHYSDKLATYLRNSGFSTILANDKDSAYQLTVSMKPRLIIWGDVLTSKNRSMIDKIKKSTNGSNISIIALIKEVELYDRMEAQKCGVDDFFDEEDSFSDLKSKMRFHLNLKNQINTLKLQIDRLKDFSDIINKMILSQDITFICDTAVEFLLKYFHINFLILNVYNPLVKRFDYFRFEALNKNMVVPFENIKEDKIWQTYYALNKHISIEEITDQSVLKILNSWNLDYKNVFQFPLTAQNKNLGILLVSFRKTIIGDPRENIILTRLCDAVGSRISEIRKLFGTHRGEIEQKLVSRDLFHRLTEDEIFIHVTKNLIKLLHADFGLYISYNEGFRFLYPKFFYKSKIEKNIFENEKPPVLLLKDFPSFDMILNQKNSVILSPDDRKFGGDLQLLPGLNNISMENAIIFPLILENSVQGFFVVGKNDIVKKYTLNDSAEGDDLVRQATEVLNENRILKKATLTIKQLDRIFDLGTELTLDVPLKDILKKICTAIRRTLGWNVVILDIKDKFENKYETVSLLGVKDSDYQNYIKTKNYPPFESRLDTSFKMCNSYFYDHKLSRRDDLNSAKEEFLKNIGSEWNDKDWLYVPIVSRGDLLGMISLNDPVDRLKPTEDRVKSVEYFANQAAVVMENTQLFESLKTSQLRYRLLAETMTMGLVSCDFDGKIIYVNQSLLKILKYESIDDLLGKSIYKLCNTASVSKFKEEVKNILSKEKEVDFSERLQGLEIELTTSQDEYIPFLIYISQYYEQNKQVGFFGVLSDLRNQKKLERMKADFNSMIVHDLRSPLNIIQGYIDIVRMQVIGKISDEQADLLKVAKDNVHKVLKLIESFLISSKIEVGKFEIEPETNSINSLVESMYEHYKIMAQEKNITIELNIDQNLPLLSFDKFRIEQVLNNFLSNALKFTKEGGKIKITTKLNKEKSEIDNEVNLAAQVLVTDSGIGIPENEIGKVFNKYEQTEAGKDATLKGTGLGLAISREIIELHQGKVGVRSKVNSGSTFFFTLPIEPIVIK